ncbi:hypothetical protein EYF80_007692 [Liparis tanakae]|uniref:Uncharacterized protein n=1 Tax=Liparis tanakae TaxID=230148 RepID=A0A4Z2IVX8_9TELE|nr:hypothetical protein EYF80_007692 [Liparis tanakae]
MEDSWKMFGQHQIVVLTGGTDHDCVHNEKLRWSHKRAQEELQPTGRLRFERSDHTAHVDDTYGPLSHTMYIHH